jgi:sterol 3beta-glucosyltransferase
LNIVILAIGTLGDVQPCIALGVGLKEAGFSVRIASHEPFRQFIIDHKLSFSPIFGDPSEWAEGEELLSLVQHGRNYYRWLRQLRKLAQPLMEDILESCLRACQGAGAIIYTPLAWAGYSLAQYLKTPCFMASMQPLNPTCYFASPWSPQNFNIGPAYNLFTHHAVEQLYWYFNKPFINHWRQNSLNLPALPSRGPFGQECWRLQKFLNAYSRFVLPIPPDWPENVHVTGYWFLKPDSQWQPPASLIDFIRSGSPPVYIGFGSIVDFNQHALLEIIIKALSKAGKRGILQINGNMLTERRISDDILNIGWTPHDWLFPQMSAIVHHGGAGTTANSLRAGVPSIIIPSAWDQPFWGKRMADLRVGPPPIQRSQLSSDRLCYSIQRAIEDKTIKLSALKLSNSICGEDGVSEAVRIIKTVVTDNRH